MLWLEKQVVNRMEEAMRERNKGDAQGEQAPGGQKGYEGELVGR